jgi:predicted lysophospholipase L1 biosynthesis ABC-type transport system permease subunit
VILKMLGATRGSSRRTLEYALLASVTALFAVVLGISAAPSSRS